MSVRIRIWRKKRAPRCCPECGRELKCDQVGYRNSLSDMLKAHYSEPRLILNKREPGWNVPCWYFVCPCNDLFDMIAERSEVFELLSKMKVGKKNWKGGTIRVPFKCGV